MAGGFLLAGAAVLLASGYGPWSSPSAPSSAPLSASIRGAPLAGAAVTPPVPPGSPAGSAPISGPPAALVAGPVELAKLLDLDRIAREGDEYVATLADGRRATLTLDPRLQTLAERLLDQSRAPRAAIVAMALDGRILALAGRKADDPEGSRKGTFDSRHATEVWAPGASIFKLVTASALLRAGVDPDGKVCYHGGLRSVLEHNLRDDRRDSRCESLTYGVAHSQNAILGKLAFQKLEPAALEAEAKLLGWNAAVPGDLGGVAGELAIPQERDLAFARAAAGFTGAKLSVLGGALLAATFASGGERPPARLVASVEGAPLAPGQPRRILPAETARAIARMMVGTCDDGSAARVFGKHRTVRVAGKTGTLTRATPFHIEHSWFVGFAPAEKPEIIVSVLIGNSERWYLRGHEVAKRLIDRALAPAPATTREKGRSAGRVRPGAAGRGPVRIGIDVKMSAS
ncbi:MAG TPA: penicillin-binding transpeptidase domain-containing protein [Kofleriaceae bacterium]|nr:penicillin-binding transpeptidase domain-containing protein [Kofleriaceae bacterium]